MVASFPAIAQVSALPEPLLDPGETIVIVGAGRESAEFLRAGLESAGLPARSVAGVADLWPLLDAHPVALVLLDLELLDRRGPPILEELSRSRPDLGLIVIGAGADLEAALECLRGGADDYLSTPVAGKGLIDSVTRVLRKRRLLIGSRVCRRDLQLANLRTQFLHHLILELNSGYLSEKELRMVLQTILIGITSAEGLAFNRAFLALFNDSGSKLKGELAIGPDSRADARAIWEKIRAENLDLQALFQMDSPELTGSNGVVNQIVRSLEISADRVDHPLIQACMSRHSILVERGRAHIPIPRSLTAALGHDSFVIVPLYSPTRSLGVIIADNFVTGKTIGQDEVRDLEIFAGQASLAIELYRLQHDMQEKIRELEMLTEELEKNKDLLVESERYRALGQMSAQLVHALRNPITSIGGTARLLDKRVAEQKNRKFLEVLARESAKVESTLNDLFSFVSDTTLDRKEQGVLDIVRRAVTVLGGVMKKRDITYHLDFPAHDPVLLVDGEKFYQALLHLIRNGIESMASGGLLTVRVEPSEDEVRIAIVDTGIGLANGELARVTDPFYTTKTYGTGMGLTLVEQILKQHDAHFSLTTNDDRGMTATITFRR